jgi:glycosyltransferase involved in cell wall biosynthesis
MNILMIFAQAPLPPPRDLGGTRRNLPFLQENLKSHSVSVLSYGTAEEEWMFQESVGKSCKHVRFVDKKRPRIVNGLERLWLLCTGRSHFRQMYRKNMQKALDELVAMEKFDVIHCCAQMFGYFSFPQGIPVVSDTHEVEYDLLYRTFKHSKNIFWKLISYLGYKLGKPEEIMLCRRFDALVATTERDCEVFRRDLSDRKIFVIQNGVPSRFFEVPSFQCEPKTMVFTGLMSFYPNHHGLLYFLDEIFPQILSKAPEARLYVVGANPLKKVRDRASDKVIVTGFVEDVRPYLGRGEVFIIPLLIGGGIRGKALEAMAMKIPIVSTTVGCEGINLRHGESALFADTPGEFADAVVHLFNDAALRAGIAERAYRNVVEGYNWAEKGKELGRVYQLLVDERAQAAAKPVQLQSIGTETRSPQITRQNLRI